MDRGCQTLQSAQPKHLVLQLIGLISGSSAPLQPVLGIFPILGVVRPKKASRDPRHYTYDTLYGYTDRIPRMLPGDLV